MQPERHDPAGIARAFVTARRDGAALAAYPGVPPQTLAEAYAVQAAALDLADAPVAGWKVGRINPPIDGVDRLSGPIFADSVIDGGTPAMPVFAEGFAAAEAEFLIRLAAAPDPAKARWTMAEAAALIGSVHVGIEVASSPYPHINRDGAFVTISDFGNNNGLVVGPAIDDWRTIDLNAIPVELRIDGVVVGAATAATMLDGPIGATRFLIEHLGRRGIALTAGQWISSGAVTGVHETRPGQRIEARFGTGYEVGCTITAR